MRFSTTKCVAVLILRFSGTALSHILVPRSSVGAADAAVIPTRTIVEEAAISTTSTQISTAGKPTSTSHSQEEISVIKDELPLVTAAPAIPACNTCTVYVDLDFKTWNDFTTVASHETDQFSSSLSASFSNGDQDFVIEYVTARPTRVHTLADGSVTTATCCTPYVIEGVRFDYEYDGTLTADTCTPTSTYDIPQRQFLLPVDADFRYDDSKKIPKNTCTTLPVAPVMLARTKTIVAQLVAPTVPAGLTPHADVITKPTPLAVQDIVTVVTSAPAGNLKQEEEQLLPLAIEAAPSKPQDGKVRGNVGNSHPSTSAATSKSGSGQVGGSIDGSSHSGAGAGKPASNAATTGDSSNHSGDFTNPPAAPVAGSPSRPKGSNGNGSGNSVNYHYPPASPSNDASSNIDASGSTLNGDSSSGNHSSGNASSGKTSGGSTSSETTSSSDNSSENNSSGNTPNEDSANQEFDGSGQPNYSPVPTLSRAPNASRASPSARQSDISGPESTMTGSHEEPESETTPSTSAGYSSQTKGATTRPSIPSPSSESSAAAAGLHVQLHFMLLSISMSALVAIINF